MPDLEVYPEQFRALGGLVPTDQELASPWQGADVSINPDERRQFVDLGVVNDDGTVDGEWRQTLVALARSTGSTTLRFNGESGSLEYVSFGLGRRDPIGLTATSQGTARIEDPAPTRRVVGLVERLTGRSDGNLARFSIDLEIPEAIVLAAIADGQRRALLSRPAEDGPTPAPIPRSEIGAALDRADPELFWLGAAVTRACGPDTEPVASVDDVIGELNASGLIEVSGGSVGLAAPCALLATRFLTLDALIDLENVRKDRQAIDTARRAVLVCLVAGPEDLLTIERVGDHVALRTISSDTLLGFVDALLGSPDALTARSTGAVAATQGFRPTHVTPEHGLPTWPTPDPYAPQGMRLGAHVEIQEIERRDDWAQVLTADGGRGWVDARRLLPIAEGPSRHDAVPQVLSPSSPPPTTPHSAAPRTAATSSTGTRRVLLHVLGLGLVVASTLVRWLGPGSILRFNGGFLIDRSFGAVGVGEILLGLVVVAALARLHPRLHWLVRLAGLLCVVVPFLFVTHLQRNYDSTGFTGIVLSNIGPGPYLAGVGGLLILFGRRPGRPETGTSR